MFKNPDCNMYDIYGVDLVVACSNTGIVVPVGYCALMASSSVRLMRFRCDANGMFCASATSLTSSQLLVCTVQVWTVLHPTGTVYCSCIATIVSSIAFLPLVVTVWFLCSSLKNVSILTYFHLFFFLKLKKILSRSWNRLLKLIVVKINRR